MKIAVLGTGMVGTTIGSKLVQLGHTVVMGSRTADNDKGRAWAASVGERGSVATFEDAAKVGELVFNCTSGKGALDALNAAGGANLAGKVLIDVTNPLDFSGGFPPKLSVCNDDSLGEQIQKAFPQTKVVKALNTVNCEVMVDPGRLPEPTDMLLCGNDADAKAQVTQFLQEQFGWKSVRDIGDITSSRGLEAWLLLWVRLWGAVGTGDFNMKLVVGQKSG